MGVRNQSHRLFPVVTLGPKKFRTSIYSESRHLFYKTK